MKNNIIMMCCSSSLCSPQDHHSLVHSRKFWEMLKSFERQIWKESVWKLILSIYLPLFILYVDCSLCNKISINCNSFLNLSALITACVLIDCNGYHRQPLLQVSGSVSLFWLLTQFCRNTLILMYWFGPADQYGDWIWFPNNFSNNQN